MRTEQPNKCLYHISYGGRGWARKTSLRPLTDRSKALVLMWSLLAVLVSEFR